MLLAIWIGLFGLAVFISAFIRSASPSLFSMATEIAISFIGLLLFWWGIRTLRSKQKTTGFKTKWKPILTAIILTFLIFLAVVVGWASYVPMLLTLVITAGFQFGSFLLKVVSSVFSGKFNLPFFALLYQPLPWLFQILFIHLIISWIKDKFDKRPA